MTGPSAEVLAEQQRLYRESLGKVRTRGLNEAEALAHYATYVGFVVATAGAGGRVLDAGCGNGWSSSALARAGYDVTGVDLNPSAFEPPPRPGLRLLAGSLLALPFADGSFDRAATYQTLEHVPEPARALSELIRVVRPGGTITVVSPNLLSILSPLRSLSRDVWRARPRLRAWVRDPGMPSHPWGNTVPENLAALISCPIRLAAKALRAGPSFTLRSPDLRPPFHADNDACYLCNPVDLLKFFRGRGCRVLRLGQIGRPTLSWLVASGTFVTVRTPEPETGRRHLP